MLLIGTADICMSLPIQKLNLDVYNFTSLRDNFGKKLNLLPFDIGIPVDSLDFDQYYANLILSDNSYFMELMKIMYSLYSGNNVFITISRRDIYETLTESLTKFIQVRYGYCSQFLNELDDLNLNDESDFSINGLKNFDMDRERFFNLMSQYGYNLEGVI